MHAPFEALAARQICRPRLARLAAIEKRAKALTERRKQFTHYRHWQREQQASLLKGPYSEPARKLLALLKRLTLDAAPDLVAHIRSGPWTGADPDTRYLVLALVDAAIADLRERHELPPFDDALPGEPLTAFQIIREVLA
jgi:hypothetical protein